MSAHIRDWNRVLPSCKPARSAGAAIGASLALLLAVAGWAPAASAESFLDVMAGIAWSQESSFQLNAAGFDRKGREDPDDSFAFGVRVGHWLEETNVVGFALDVSYFEPHIENTFGGNLFDVRAIPISLLFMARLPIGVTSELPNGRLQPYVALGPSLVLTLTNGPFGFEDVGTSAGVDVRGGLNFEFMEGFGMFTEYRFSYTEAEIEDAFGIAGVAVPATLRVGLKTHHAVAGLRVSF